MFYLKELFNDLAYGEFSNISLGNSLAGVSDINQYPKVVSAINAGLLALYTRFQLKTKKLILYQRADKFLYYIRSSHMGDPNAGDPEIYIDGLGDDPPNGDIIRFIEAYDVDENEIFINDPKHPDDFKTPELDILKITPSDPLKVITLVYQAAYPKIVITEDFDPDTYALYFPEFLRPALLAKVASRILTGKTTNAVEGQAHAGNTFMYAYEVACKRIESLGLVSNVEIESTQFVDNGWV